MPANTGRAPQVELVDVTYRNGVVSRGIDPKQRRWKSWPDGPDEWDIVRWQKARE